MDLNWKEVWRKREFSSRGDSDERSEEHQRGVSPYEERSEFNFLPPLPKLMSEKILLEKIINSGLIKKNDKIVIGLSGGPDSTALTLLLNKLKNKFNLSLFLVHINYHLRGKESEKDEFFSRNLAERLNISIFVHSVNKNTLKKNRQSLQDLARKIRLKYFIKIAKKCNANKIGLAHQVDDQAETILIKLLRGSGKEGLSGIARSRPITGGIEIIHPLISISRKEILKFLKKEKQPYRLDASNLKPVYKRNEIRLHLLPMLEKIYQPQIKNILNNMAEIFSMENDYLEKLTQKNATKFIIKEIHGKNLLLNAEKLKKIHPALQSRLLQFFIKKFTSGYNINFGQIQSIRKILSNKKAHLDLPQKITLEKIDGELLIKI